MPKAIDLHGAPPRATTPSAAQSACVLLSTLFMIFAFPAHGMMAGASNGSDADTPSARVDANISTSPWASVGSISVGGGVYSGVLIDPMHVLTAAHVVRSANPQDITFTLNAGGPPRAFAVARSFIHPNYHGTSPAGIAFNDLAVLQLVKPVLDEIAIHPLLEQPLPVGSRITLVGYGASGNADIGATIPGNPNIKRVGGNVIGAFAPAVKQFEYPLAYTIRFDPPSLPNGKPNPASLGNRIETLPAPGDSGSPAFVKLHGEWRLAGINTFVAKLGPATPAGGFGQLAGGMWLPAYAPWISKVLRDGLSTTSVRRPLAHLWSGY